MASVYPSYIVTRKNLTLKSKFWMYSILAHILAIAILFLLRDDDPVEILYSVKLVDTKTRISEKEVLDIQKQIDKVQKERQSAKKSNSPAGATRANENPAENSALTNEPVNREDQFDRNFEKTMFSKNSTSTKSVPLPGSTNSAAGWEKEGKSGKTGNKSQTGENIKAPDGNAGAGKFNWKGGFTRRLVYMPKVDYPLYFRQQGIQSDVLCQVEVDASGKVVEVQILRSSGHSKLDILAKNALRAARFSPGSSAENDVGEVSIRFNLKN